MLSVQRPVSSDQVVSTTRVSKQMLRMSNFRCTPCKSVIPRQLNPTHGESLCYSQRMISFCPAHWDLKSVEVANLRSESGVSWDSVQACQGYSRKTVERDGNVPGKAQAASAPSSGLANPSPRNVDGDSRSGSRVGVGAPGASDIVALLAKGRRRISTRVPTHYPRKVGRCSLDHHILEPELARDLDVGSESAVSTADDDPAARVVSPLRGHDRGRRHSHSIVVLDVGAGSGVHALGGGSGRALHAG